MYTVEVTATYRLPPSYARPHGSVLTDLHTARVRTLAECDAFTEQHRKRYSRARRGIVTVDARYIGDAGLIVTRRTT